MSYKNILIGSNTFYSDWLISLRKIKKENIIVINFNEENILKKIKEKNINYILPLSSTDHEIVKNITISDDIPILYPNIETIGLLNNKISFTKFMLENFTECLPEVYYLEDKKLKELEFPVISKPIYSTNGLGMKIYHSENDFAQCKNKHIVQKFIDDEYKYSCYMLCINGIIINWKVIRCKYKKYHIKTSNFSSDYENVENFDMKLFENIVHKLNYTGGMCVDFKFNSDTNSTYIFEINPRFGGSAFTNNFIYELLCVK